MRLALAAPLVAGALALLVAACAVWTAVEPVVVAPVRCLYGGGGMYNPAWWGPCPTPTPGPVVYQIVLGAPNPTETPWPN